MICGQLIDPHPSGVVGIRSANDRTIVRVAEIVDDDEVVGHTAVRRALDPIQHFNDGPNLDRQSSLFTQLSGDRCLQCFTELHRTTGQAPLSFQRFVRALG